jgi:hypothetical protein
MTRLLLRLTRAAVRLTAWLTRRRVAAQAVAGLLALGFGMWGWTLQAPPADFAGWFNNLFRTIQLITLQFPTTLETGIVWQLQVARLAVPLVAAAATFNILIGAVTRPVRLALLPHMRGHIILCGAEQLTRAALLDLAARGEQIVWAGPALDPARREALEGLGLTIVEADPRAPGAFAALNLREAAALFLTGEDDVANLNLAMLAMEALAGRPAALPPLVLAVLLDREDLANELDAALDGLSRQAGLRYHRLCPDREGLRLELAGVAPVFLKPDRDVRSHILLVGLVGNWEQVMAQLLAAGQDHPALPPLLTLVLDEGEAAAFAAWRRARPELEHVAEFTVLARGAALMPEGAALAAWRAEHPPPQLAVVLRADADAVATALALRRAGTPFGTEAAPILVRQSHEDLLLSRLGAAPVGHVRLQGLIAFGGLIRAQSIARVLDRAGDDLAMALHAAYLVADDGGPDSRLPWDALPENLREANRAAAEHAPILFASLGLLADKAPLALDAAQREALARIEHRRWMCDRIARGWRHGEARDAARLLHPSLRPFETLSEAERARDHRGVSALVQAARGGRG